MRDKELRVKVTKDERELIKEKAKSHNMKISDYIRIVALKNYQFKLVDTEK